MAFQATLLTNEYNAPLKILTLISREIILHEKILYTLKFFS